MCCHLPTDGHWGGRRGRSCGGHGWRSDVNDVAIRVMWKMECVRRPIRLKLIRIDDATGDHVSDGTLITRTPAYSVH